MIPRQLSRFWLLVAPALLAPTGRTVGQAQQPPQLSALIFEGSGVAGPFKIGDAVWRYADLLTRVPGQPGVYLSVDSSIRVTATAEGMIQTVQVSNPAMFTTRGVTPGVSTLRDVQLKYGPFQSMGVTKDGRLILVYSGIEFAFENTPPCKKAAPSLVMPAPRLPPGVVPAPAPNCADAVLRTKVRSVTLTTLRP